ncbi:MAG: hypothetical protein ACJAYE_000480, partial [Candidatus Azotimanducaceae bacterium]
EFNEEFGEEFDTAVSADRGASGGFFIMRQLLGYRIIILFLYTVL